MIITNLAQIHRDHVRFSQRHDQMVDTALVVGGTEAVQRVKETRFKRPSPSGGVRDKTEFRIVRTRSGKVLKIRNTAKHAAPLDKGARPHVIRAKAGKVLAFRGRSGKMIFRNKVNHPGNKPTRFLWKATRSAYRVTGTYLEEQAKLLARRF